MEQSPKQKKRTVTVDIHVLAYLGDYVTAFKAAIRKKAQDVLSSGTAQSVTVQSGTKIPSLQVRSPVGQS